jgi:hypothetical protein
LGKTVRHLHLDYNDIDRLEDGVLDNMVGLTRLFLSGNAGIKLSNKVSENKII